MSNKLDNKELMKKIFEAHIITLGDSKVGKSSLIIRYMENTFVETYISTLGIDSRQKNIKLSNGEEIRVKITDSAGEERFRALSANYIKKANGILLVYDITNKDSFENINIWAQEIKDKSESIDERPIVLIGNKLDLEEERCINKEQGEKFAEKYCNGGIKFYETSCKTGENIEKAINDLAEQIYEKFFCNINENSFSIHKDKKTKEKGKCCK